MEKPGWSGVRCVSRFERDPQPVYEERVTLWRAAGAKEAVELAESEAGKYVQDLDGEYLGLAQVYAMVDDVGHGAEVFSLMRTSRLGSAQYVDTFFDTGAEHHTAVEP